MFRMHENKRLTIKVGSNRMLSFARNASKRNSSIILGVNYYGENNNMNLPNQQQQLNGVSQLKHLEMKLNHDINLPEIDELPETDVEKEKLVRLLQNDEFENTEKCELLELAANKLYLDFEDDQSVNFESEFSIL